MFRYRLHSPGGDDLGEATYAMMIKSREENGSQQSRIGSRSAAGIAAHVAAERLVAACVFSLTADPGSP
jgi:hypothetical protein